MTQTKGPLLSTFQGTRDPVPRATRSLADVLTDIRTGVHASAIAHVRHLLTHEGKDAYTHAKGDLPGFTPCGLFHPRRAKAALLQHSGIVHLDLDNLPTPEHTRKTLLCQALVYAFISPSAHGLKLGYRISPVANDSAYKHAWRAVAAMVQTTYGVQVDASGSDISRLCYFSHDTTAYINLRALRLAIPVPEAPPVTPVPHCEPLPTSPDRKHCYLAVALRNAETLLDRSQDGTRHAARLKAGRLIGGYTPEFLSADEAFTLLEAAVLRNTRTPGPALKTLRDALAYGAQHPITLAAREMERQVWKGARG